MTWEVKTSLTTIKIGRALWMTAIPHDFQTPKGLVTVPAGFLFDHASVPRIFTSIVPPVKSCLAEASLLHDWFYCKDSGCPGVSRKYADTGLKMLTLNQAKYTNKTDKAIARLAYRAVRIGARKLYNKQFCYEKYKDAYFYYKNKYSLPKLQEKLIISYIGG